MASSFPFNDPALMEEAAHALAALLAEHLRRLGSAPARAEPRSAGERLAQAEAALDRGRPDLSPDEAVTRLRELAGELVRGTLDWRSPRTVGHQVCAPVAVSGVMALLNGVLNSSTALSEVGELPVAAERALIKRLGGIIGWHEGFDGIVTSGGSLANLTGILAARNHRVADAWARGVPKGLAILCNADSHYSVVRAAGILGIGVEQVLKVGLDSRRRISLPELERAYESARSRGLDPFCIAGTAGTTNVGAFDPLSEIGAFAREKGVWFHVDAAHGGGLAFSKRHRGLLKGIELADSLVWDAHKMMHVPTLCTFLLYRERARSFLPFQQDAPYLFSGDEEAVADPAHRTLECTRPALATPLWVLWSLFGQGIFEEINDRVLATTRRFHEMLTGDFEASHEPECNILCFRYLPGRLRGAPTEIVSNFQRAVRAQVLERGRFFITGTEFDGSYRLRVTIMNPETGEKHLRELLGEIRRAASLVGSSFSMYTLSDGIQGPRGGTDAGNELHPPDHRRG